MLFNSIEFLFAILIGLLKLNRADKFEHNITAPAIIKRTCSNVTFSFHVHFVKYPINIAVSMGIHTSKDIHHYVATSSHTRGVFKFYKVRSIFSDYVTVRVDPPHPQTWGVKRTFYLTFRFPDERHIYGMSIYGFYKNARDKLYSPQSIGKSRCFPQDDITGCDPYCVCDTVVQRKCPNGSPIRGKCLDIGSFTNNSGIYTFDERCGTAAETSFQTFSSFNPSTSRSSTSKPSSTRSFSSSSTESTSNSFVASQALESMFGIGAGIIIAVFAIIAFTFCKKKKKGGQFTVSDEIETKENFITD